MKKSNQLIEVDHSSFGLNKVTAAGSFEISTSGTEDYSVTMPGAPLEVDGEIGIFDIGKESERLLEY